MTQMDELIAREGDQERAKEIVGKLTPNAKQVVRAMTGEFAPAPRGMTRQLVASVVSRIGSLFEREWQDGCAQCTYYRLTPLGLAVRHLITQGKGEKR